MRSLLIFCLFLTLNVSAEEAQKEAKPDFDSLGGNSVLLDRARALEPEKNVSIVQQRVVDRRRRIELSPEINRVVGGQNYVLTKGLGLNANFHFTPRFSVGAKYTYFVNDLTEEGQAQVDRAEQDFLANPGNPTASYPELNWAKEEILGLANWYPIYGKINWFDKRVIHFDVYALGGYGQITLKTGSAPTYTAGGGIGFWFNQHFTTRFELRYQNYTAKYATNSKDLDLTVGSMQMGWML